MKHRLVTTKSHLCLATWIFNSKSLDVGFGMSDFGRVAADFSNPMLKVFYQKRIV
jgi:hypothetical protein